jgi:hypothetical protein
MTRQAIISNLRAQGFPDDLIAGTIVDGRPLSDSMPKPKAAPAPNEDEKPKKKKKAKYRNVETKVDGITFKSRKEAGRYLYHKGRKERGEIRTFLRQVPFDLPGATERGGRLRYWADFVVINLDWTIEVEDVKGVLTDVYKLKRALVKEAHGIEIREV